MTVDSSDPNLLSLAADIVSAHVAHNAVSAGALPGLIRSAYAALVGLGAEAADPVEKLGAAVPIKKSVFPDYIVRLEDGKRLQMLKRHLKTAYGMTPEQYREKWSLPRDYPMTAPKYAARRSVLAKTAGLGRKGAEPRAPTAEAGPSLPPIQKVPERARGKGVARKRGAGVVKHLA
jgi:predicted transcriptional regulator